MRIKCLCIASWFLQAFVASSLFGQTEEKLDARLSSEGQRMQAAHQYLFGVIAKQGMPEFTGNDPAYLRRIEISTQEYLVEGTRDIPLELSVERVLPMFRYIELTGTGLDGLGKISLLPSGVGIPLPVSTQTPTLYRVKLPALATPDENTPKSAIRLTGLGTVQSVALVPFGGGIAEDFDSAPYRNLGTDQPAAKVDIRIDTRHELSIDGHIEIDRTKWFRYYGSPNGVPRAMEQYAFDRGFSPGRQIFKFEPALEKGYSKNQPLLHQDPVRSGWPDPTFFDRYQSDPYANRFGPFRKIPFAMCFNDYPSFMSVEHTGRGTPLPDHFDAAAELVTRFLTNQLQHSGTTATYWELKNESTIKAEWDHHWKKGVDSWRLLAQFHNVVADAVHQKVPGVQIGGPSSAWMQVQIGNFSLWKNQQQFMDETRGHLDFYSHHFYEDMGTLGAYEKRATGYRNYLLGRLESILDMFQAHMHASDNVRPILLTEYGALNVGKSEADYWLRIRTYSAFLTRLMDRPEQIEMAVPFVFLASHWDPQNGHSVFVPTGEPGDRNDLNQYRKTADGYFFELWKDFRGRRLPTQCKQPWLSVVAAHDGPFVRVAISNMGGQRLRVRLSDLGGIPLGTNTRQRRLHVHDGKIIFADAIVIAPTDPISVAPEETTIVTIQLKQPLGSLEPVVRQSWYAPQTAVLLTDSGVESFPIRIDDRNSFVNASLIIGMQRDGGLAEPLTGFINGNPFRIDNQRWKHVPQLFESVELEVDCANILAENKIEINAQDGLTISAVRIQTTRH